MDWLVAGLSTLGLAGPRHAARQEGRGHGEAAVDERKRRGRELQRRDRQAVTIGDGDGVEPDPRGGNERRRRLADLGRERGSTADLAEEGPCRSMPRSSAAFAAPIFEE